MRKFLIKQPVCDADGNSSGFIPYKELKRVMPNLKDKDELLKLCKDGDPLDFVEREDGFVEVMLPDEFFNEEKEAASSEVAVCRTQPLPEPLQGS